MSYEEFTQYLCKNGHYHTQDCDYDDLTVCPDCIADMVWSNMVDETNGAFEIDCNGNTTKKRIDGYIKLEVKEQKKCDHCNSILEITYKIPKRKKNKCD